MRHCGVVSMLYPTPSSSNPVRGNSHHLHFTDALTDAQDVNKSVDPKVVPLPCNLTQPVCPAGDPAGQGLAFHMSNKNNTLLKQIVRS